MPEQVLHAKQGTRPLKFAEKVLPARQLAVQVLPSVAVKPDAHPQTASAKGVQAEMVVWPVPVQALQARQMGIVILNDSQYPLVHTHVVKSGEESEWAPQALHVLEDVPAAE